MSILRTHPESRCRWIFFAHSLGRKERYQSLSPLVLAAAYKVGKATWASICMLLVLKNSNFAVSLAALICPWLIAYLCQIVAVDLEWSAQITDTDTQTDLENPLCHKSQLHKSPIHWITVQILQNRFTFRESCENQKPLLKSLWRPRLMRT